MPKVKLTESQRKALNALIEGERGAYPDLHLGTLNALSLRGLVRATWGQGAMGMSRTDIRWSITDAGRAALKDGA